MTIQRTIARTLLGFCALQLSVSGQTLTGVLGPRGGHPYDEFGRTLALSGQTLVVGSPGWEPSPNFQDVGAAHVYESNQGSWVLRAHLVPGSPVHQAGFGRALAVAGDTIAVGSPTAGLGEETPGLVHLFSPGPGGWQEFQVLDPGGGSDDHRFGFALAFDGINLLVGSPQDDALGAGAGRVRSYRRSSMLWQPSGTLDPPPGLGLRFGESLTADPGWIVVGAPGVRDERGAAFLYRTGTTGIQGRGTVGSPTGAPGENFGACLSMSAGRLAVGVPGAGRVELFEVVEEEWVYRGRLSPTEPGPADSTGFGSRVQLFGNWLAVGADPTVGRVWLYRRAGAGWVEVDSLGSSSAASGDRLGEALALSNGKLLVGAPGAGAEGRVRLYDLEGAPQVDTFCGGSNCPCGNESSPGGCMNSSGAGARLSAWGSLRLSCQDLTLCIDRGPAGRIALLATGSRAAPSFFGDGLLCLAPQGGGFGPLTLLGTGQTDALGTARWKISASSLGSVDRTPRTVRFQAFVRDSGGPCGSQFNSTSALALALRL